MNLPNAITLGRIAITPLVAILPFVGAWEWRLAAFVLYIIAAVTDYVDGRLARERNEETDLGRLLDPLADKMLLLGTLVPMFLLQGTAGGLSPLTPLLRPAVDGLVDGPWVRDGGWITTAFPFASPFGPISLPLWIVVVVLGRELVMTIFRQIAARRGIIISAIGPAKWKTGFQWVWVGAAFFWFFAATLAAERQWDTLSWHAFALFNSLVGLTTMIGALVLTLYSLWLYGRKFAGPVWRAGG